MLLGYSWSRITERKSSYAQCGEDVIVDFIFSNLKISKPTYIDVGAHHPYRMNNTVLFYLRGSYGINIEPNPYFYKKLKQNRRRDLNLPIGIYDTKTILPFFVLNPPTLSTFSETEAYSLEKEGYVIDEVLEIAVDSITHVVQEYCKGKFPDFLSIDTEGLDEIIIKTLDSSSLPKVICVEKGTYASKKKYNIEQHLLDLGYMDFAHNDTNMILVQAYLWNNRQYLFAEDDK